MPHLPDRRDSFDAASIPGMRARLADHYAKFRIVEEDAAQWQAPPAVGGSAGEYIVRPCPCCGDDPPAGPPIISAHGLDIVACPVCEFVYCRSVLDEESDAAIYRGSLLDIAFDELRDADPYIQLESVRSRYYLSTIAERDARTGKMLDIGCGSGTFLAQAAALGWEVLGLEPNPTSSEVARSRGIRVANGYFPHDLPDEGETFDLITALDVLEHFTKPRSMLGQIWERLAPRGLLFIQVPNWESLLVQIEGENSTVICPSHWSHFSRKTLTSLVTSEGFEPLALQTVVTELDRIEGFPPALVEATFRRLRPGVPMPTPLCSRDLYDHDLGYKLIGIFRKVDRRD